MHASVTAAPFVQRLAIYFATIRTDSTYSWTYAAILRCLAMAHWMVGKLPLFLAL